MRAGRALTARLGLADCVTHRVGNALALDVAPGAEPSPASPVPTRV